MKHTLCALLEHAATNAPNHIALIDNDVQYTYSQLRDMSTRFAHYLLHAHSISCYSRIGVYMGNSVEQIISIFAIARIGAIFVPINANATVSQIEHIVDDCNIMKIILNESQQLNIPFSRCLSFWEGGWNDLTESESDSFSTAPISSDLAAILYTSGSTGKPKGIMVTHDNLVAGADSICEYLRITQNDRLLSILPFSFDYGLNQLLTCFRQHATLIIKNPYTMFEIPFLIEHYEITGLAGVPTIWVHLIQQRNIAKYGYRKLRYITNSGGSLPAFCLDELPVCFPHTDIYLMYGLTEAFRSTYLEPKEYSRKKGSIGKSIPNAEVMVLNKEGAICKPFEVGELVTRGPMVTLGYWGNEDATREVFRPNPQMISQLKNKDIAVFSGDLGYMDEEGFLFFQGRNNNMIKHHGVRISPTEIEEILYLARGIVECAVVGVKDPVDDEQIVAYLCVKENEDKISLLNEIKELCQEKLPTYMYPSDFIFLKRLPKTTTGKVDTGKLKGAYYEYLQCGDQ